MDITETTIKRASAAEVLVIDDDFDQAAFYYSGQAFGRDKASILVELKRRYDDDEDLDNMVFILARHRCTHNPTAPKEPFYVGKNADRPFDIQTLIEDLVPACSEPWLPGIKEMRRGLLWRFYDRLVKGIPDFRDRQVKNDLKTTLSFIETLSVPDSPSLRILEGLTEALSHARGEDVGATVHTYQVSPQGSVELDTQAYSDAVDFGVMGGLNYPNQEGNNAMEAAVRAGISRYVSLISRKDN